MHADNVSTDIVLYEEILFKENQGMTIKRMETHMQTVAVRPESLTYLTPNI